MILLATAELLPGMVVIRIGSPDMRPVLLASVQDASPERDEATVYEVDGWYDDGLLNMPAARFYVGCTQQWAVIADAKTAL